MSIVNLPYRTDWDPMLEVLDYLKGGAVERARLDARFGGGEPMRETLNALEQLDLITREDDEAVRLTNTGEVLAYAPDQTARLQTLGELLLDYHPYAVPLMRAVGQGKREIEAPWVEHVWQIDMRLGQPRNRVAEARTCFFRLAEAAGLGRYRRGVRGQPSRLELSDRASELVAAQASVAGASNTPEDAEETMRDHEMAGQRAGDDEVARSSPLQIPAGSGYQLSVTVDLTDWDIEKIRAFFDLLRESGLDG